jgi:hypothetical protein
VGTHLISASVTDSHGAPGSAQISITVAANSAPVVAITSPAGGSNSIETDAVAFTGTASDTEDGDLAASLAWTSDLDGAIGSGATFPLTTLSVGTHLISASVTDSHGAPGSAQISLTVAANTAPAVAITSPAGGSTSIETDSVTFAATASDPEDGDLAASLAWTSDLDGAIGSGATFPLTTLSVGTHLISASVTDSHGAPGSAQISITVAANSAPVVAITSPAGGSTSIETDSVTFTATAADTEDGDLAAGLAWTSDLDGAIGSGGSFGLTSLSVGTHLVTASVSDSHGAPGSAQISVTVAANTTPVVAITSPADTSTWIETDPVIFTGTAGDSEDGDLAANLSWTSDLDGPIGSGATFALTTLSVGTHLITASVVDSHGAAGSALIGVTVNVNTAPAVSIEEPTPLSTSVEGSPLTFTGSSLDLEDGDLSAGLVWTSDLDLQIGTGASFTTSSLSVGTHQITATSTDSHGLAGIASIITLRLPEPGGEGLLAGLVCLAALARHRRASRG